MNFQKYSECTNKPTILSYKKYYSLNCDKIHVSRKDENSNLCPLFEINLKNG